METITRGSNLDTAKLIEIVLACSLYRLKIFPNIDQQTSAPTILGVISIVTGSNYIAWNFEIIVGYSIMGPRFSDCNYIRTRLGSK